MNSDWRKKQRNSLQFQSVEHIGKTPASTKTISLIAFSSPTEKIMESGRITPVNAPPIIPPKFVKAYNQYPTSFLYQLYVLLKRTFLILSRDRTLTYSRLGTHTGIALVIGILYYGIGIDASNMLNNFNFIFFSVMFLMLTAFNCVTTTCKYIYLFSYSTTMKMHPR